MTELIDVAANIIDLSDWVSVASAFVGVLIGSCVTGYFTILAVKKAHLNNLELAERNENALIEGLMQSIHDEIDLVFEEYKKTVGDLVGALEKDGALNFYYPITGDFFTIFNSNAFLIGRIKDLDLRRQIIKTYILAKGMVDNFKLNNDFVHKYEAAAILYSETGKESHKNIAEANYKTLINYGQIIKQSHISIVDEVAKLLLMIKKALPNRNVVEYELDRQ